MPRFAYYGIKELNNIPFDKINDNGAIIFPVMSKFAALFDLDFRNAMILNDEALFLFGKTRWTRGSDINEWRRKTVAMFEYLNVKDDNRLNELREKIKLSK